MCVVVGYVATPEGESALATAIEEARSRSVTLLVILSERGHLGADGVELQSRADAVEDRLEAEGVRFEIRQTTRGRDVAEDIVGAAEADRAELIVIGLRRRSPVGKLLLGSNAQRILLDAPCPVLAVKPSPA